MSAPDDAPKSTLKIPLALGAVTYVAQIAGRDSRWEPRMLHRLNEQTLTRRRLKHGVFKSVDELKGAIDRFVDEHKYTEAKPFIWRADPDKIIAVRNRGFQILESSTRRVFAYSAVAGLIGYSFYSNTVSFTWAESDETGDAFSLKYAKLVHRIHTTPQINRTKSDNFG
jgi:hypothetical protein